ncbi:MAG: 1,6-anhydro-N-acetylmuramyl-L-alanine amidase AmpD [bacterium]
MTSIDSPLLIDDAGWCSSLPRAACLNFDARPADTPVSLLVIHNISLPPGEFGGSWIEDLFANTLDCDAHPYFNHLRGVKVSAHFLVRRDGRVVQFVSTNDRAWHAGVSEFRGRQRCNDFSVGIELEGSDFENFCDAQYKSLALLTHSLTNKYPITDVVGHQHIAPDRKTDPGPCFDWERFQRECLEKLIYSTNQASQNHKLRFPD